MIDRMSDEGERADEAAGRGRLAFLGPIPRIASWLGGSLALISAVFYAAGYLALRAQLELLGLAGLVSPSNQRFVQEGGRFFLELGLELNTLLSLLILGGLAALVIYGIARPILAWRRRKRPERVGWLRRWAARHHLRLRVIGFVALVITLFALARDPDEFLAPLQISGLLFEPSAPPPSEGTLSDAESLRRLLLSGDEEGLRWRFREYLAFELLALALFLGSWWLAARWRLRLLLTAPFWLVLVIYTLALPMLYGVLRYREAAPVVSVNAEALGRPEGSELFLLERTEEELLLWDPASRRAIWLPFAGVRSAEVLRIDYLVRPGAGAGAGGGA